MSIGSLVALIVFITLAAWVLFMVYLRAKPDAAPEIEGSIMASSGERNPRPRASFDDAAGVTRRQFLNRAYVAAVVVALGNFALASLDFLWPRNTGGLGGKVIVGDASQLRSQLESTRVPIADSDTAVLPPGIFLMTYEGQPAAAAKVPAYVQANTAESGFVALYRKCVHLGCTVPFCNTSKWFECPCHGSKYSINGEYRAGPAPRSLDRFRVDIVNGQVVVDTSTLITGPPRGTVTSQPNAEGTHCVNISGA
ncbi:MAG TPA: Rieske 2Fe-2S domain-containing protein [Actinomycetota bacterium]|nr:Rieske 2Fe-2S domain-containing protein [Actinomycetota bacterium]